MSTKAAPRKDLVITRVFDAPRNLVFNCWTDAKHLERWFGPRHYTIEVPVLEPRQGGKLRAIMRHPDGTTHPMNGVFREIVPVERIVLAITVDNGANYMFDVTETITFEDAGGKTKLTIRAHLDKVAPGVDVDGMGQGYTEMLDRLGDAVVPKPAGSVKHDTFRIEREFKAPVSLVYDAWASKDAKSRWFTIPPGWSGRHELDFRVGGRELLISTPPGEPEHRVESTYQNIVRDSRIIYTYNMYVGDATVASTLVTIEFHQTASGTQLALTEQGACLDGMEGVPARQGGTYMLNNLEAELTRLTSPRPV